MKSIKFMTLIALITGSLLTAGVAYGTETTYGYSAAIIDTNYTLEEMLDYAIQDEFVAQAEYNAIIGKLGSVRPFSNIVRAESTHINLLLPLFKTYGYTVPTNEAASFVTVPTSLTESYAIGIAAEKNNIAMYQAFIKEDLPADVQIVFERLLAASENHLKAFQNASTGNATYGMMRNGNSMGFGNRNWVNNTNAGTYNNGNARQGRGMGNMGAYNGVCVNQ
jgi:hypothetical protein